MYRRMGGRISESLWICDSPCSVLHPSLCQHLCILQDNPLLSQPYQVPHLSFWEYQQEESGKGSKQKEKCCLVPHASCLCDLLVANQHPEPDGGHGDACQLLALLLLHLLLFPLFRNGLHLLQPSPVWLDNGVSRIQILG